MPEPRPAAPDDGSVLPVIAEAFTRARQPHLPKIAQLYNALVEVIASGRLASGSKLPGERELSETLGISLGTTQRSLQLLTRDGQISREHGRGSFVRAGPRPLHELWHFRFRRTEGDGLLPVYARLLGRSRIGDDGPWTDELGPDEAGYVRIERLIDVDGRFSCWSEMMLPASRFGRLLEVPAAAIESANLKRLLRDEFDTPTISVRQTVRIGSISDAVARLVAPSDRRSCLTLHITALSRFAAPISFQRIVVPPTEHEMELGADPGIGMEPRRAT